MRGDERLDQLGRVTRRKPYPYASSWPLEEVEVTGRDGSTRRVLLKHFDGSPKKPALVRYPEREIAMYNLLAGEELGTPRCYAAGQSWIALEKVEGVELWQRSDRQAWEATARWAARLHAHFSGRRLCAPPLLRRDASFHRRWFARARALSGTALDGMGPACEAAVLRLEAQPQTLIHGELYPSNVLIADDRVAVVDWEMAAIGPGVIDLAALVTGWPEQDREAIVQAFGGADVLDLAAARIVLALQWLGWRKDWQPPPAHGRDWYAEARSAAEVLI